MTFSEMKFVIFLSMVLVLSSCTDYGRVVKKAYKENNPHAKEILLHGFNGKVSEYIDSETLDRALGGDEEAKKIIYAQMEMLRGMPSSHTHVTPAPIIINHVRPK